MSAPAGTTLRPGSIPASSIGPAWATSPRRTSCTAGPGERRSRATWTTKGSAAMLSDWSWSKKPSSSVRLPSSTTGDGVERTVRPAGPAGLDRPGEPVQHDLHAGQLGVHEVLGLVAERPASSLASSRMRCATELAWRTISVRCTMCSAWARTSSISASASRLRSAMNSSRSRRSQRAWRSSSGRHSMADCTSEVTSSARP